MVQLIAVAAVGAVVWVGVSSFRKHMLALKQQEAKRAEEAKIIPDLEQDPKTGRYKPRD